MSKIDETSGLTCANTPTDHSGFASKLSRTVSLAGALRWLLAKLGSLLTLGFRARPSNIEDCEDIIASSEIKYLSLAEWDNHRRLTSESSVAAIDVLTEEINSDAGRQRGLRKGPAVSQVGDSLFDLAPKDTDVRPALPPKIRVNSRAIKGILSGLCDDRLSGHKSSPLILIRPFKVLILFEDSIREKLQELDTVLKTRQVHFDKYPDTRTPSKLRNRMMPPQGMFSTGTDWESLTLHELKQASYDFACLVQFMDKFLKPIEPGQCPNRLPFADLWHLFMSEDYVYVREKPQKIWRLLQATGGRQHLSAPGSDPAEATRNSTDGYSPFVIDAYHLDYDGTAISPVFETFSLERVDEYVQLRNLPYLPLQIAQKEGLVDIDATRRRGELFLEYCVPQHGHYNGLTLSRKPSGSDLFRQVPGSALPQRVLSERINSQVVVDYERAIQANPGWNTGSSMPRTTTVSPSETHDYIESAEPDWIWDKSFSEDLLDEQSKLWRSWRQGTGQPDGDHLLLLPDQVYGYILNNRTWACLQIGTTGPTVGRLQRAKIREDSPWQDLEIPSDHKQMVEALVSHYFSADRAGDELIRGKWGGLIVLLHGVPGVGKTATAECVAEAAGRPLLSITCGDLGVQPKEVEEALSSAFQLAQAWDCVMLLDEADIFLAQRENHDLERNALVSMFLRILEYYEGVLFLTTNRVGAFDEAFKARIHIALYYPPLNLDQTRKIWSAHIHRGRNGNVRVDCNKQQILDFAETLFRDQLDDVQHIGSVWNGRQIRNAFRSAVALARNQTVSTSSDTIVLEVRHFQQVAEVSNHFNNRIFATENAHNDPDLVRQLAGREHNHTDSRPQQGSMSQYRSDAHGATSLVRQATTLAPDLNVDNCPTPAFHPTGFDQPNFHSLSQSPGPYYPADQQYAQATLPPQTEQTMYHVQHPQQMTNYEPLPMLYGPPVGYMIYPHHALHHQAMPGVQSHQQGQSFYAAYGAPGAVYWPPPQVIMLPPQLQWRPYDAQGRDYQSMSGGRVSSAGSSTVPKEMWRRERGI